MAREREIKIQLKIPLEELLKRIQKKGYRLLHSLKQIDIYFDTKDWFLYKNLAALRLRKVDGKDHSFSFKKVFYLPNKQGNYYIEEIETKTPFVQAEEMHKIFDRLKIPDQKHPFKSGKELSSYLAKFQYFDEQKMPKKRKVYSDGKNEFVIDDVEQVGIIVELECQENEPLEEIKNILAEDEWARSIEGTSYIWLKNVKGLNLHLSNFEKFKSKPDWNVWENEKDWYKEMIH